MERATETLRAVVRAIIDDADEDGDYEGHRLIIIIIGGVFWGGSRWNERTSSCTEP